MKQAPPKPTDKQSQNKRRVSAFLFARLGFQNLLRRPTRTLMLVAAVALSTGAIFASAVIGRGIVTSMEQSFARMGADLIAVPDAAMVNITSALLTVQPTEATFAPQILAEIKALNGVEQVAPQTVYRVQIMSGMPEHKVNLIAFDPASDFTIMPWIQTRLSRPLRTGDVLAGGRRTESLDDEIEPCNSPATVYGKLGRSGVGPLDESFFASYDTVAALRKSKTPAGLSAVLVKLAFGATPEQVRFAMARLKGVKIISGSTIITSTRQTTTALLLGMLGFAAIMLMGVLILVSLLFGAIIAERRREIGLLNAIGTRRTDIVQMLVAEAAISTGLGGCCGVILGSGLLYFFQRSLVYYLETMRVEFIWPSAIEIVLVATACATMAAMLGLLGAFVPAWKAGHEEPYKLIQGEIG